MESKSTAPAASKRKFVFTYDAGGRRIQKEDYTWNTGTSSYQLSTTVKFLYDGWDLIAELDGSGTPLRTYGWLGKSGGLLWVKDEASGEFHVPSFDGNRNVTKLIKWSDRSVAAEFEYAPFGSVLRATGPMASSMPFQFSSEYHDEGTGLVYYGYRYYSPQTHRWLSKDPIGYAGGLNLYGFVGNDPVNGRDILGLSDDNRPPVVATANCPAGYGPPAPEPRISAAEKRREEAEIAAGYGALKWGLETSMGVVEMTSPLPGITPTDIIIDNARPHLDSLWNKVESQFTEEQAYIYAYTGPVLDIVSVVAGGQGLIAKAAPKIAGAIEARLARLLPKPKPGRVGGINIEIPNWLERLADESGSIFPKGRKTRQARKSAAKQQEIKCPEYGPTKRRVDPRKKTLEDVTANQPRNASGEMVDPHTQKPLDPDWTDLGHKDMTWKERKALYEHQGLSRRQVIERENDPSGYWWEDRSENRSRKWDK